MFSAIYTIYNWFVGIEHDVEQIISSFTDTVAKLEAAALAKAKEAEQHMADSMHFEALGDNAFAAAEKAEAVAAKIKALVA